MDPSTMMGDVQQSEGLANPSAFQNTGGLANPMQFQSPGPGGANPLMGVLGPGMGEGASRGFNDIRMQQQYEMLQKQQATEQAMREFQLQQAKDNEAATGGLRRQLGAGGLQQSIDLLPSLKHLKDTQMHSEISVAELKGAQADINKQMTRNDALDGLNDSITNANGKNDEMVPAGMIDKVREEYKAATGKEAPTDSTLLRNAVRDASVQAKAQATRFGPYLLHLRKLEEEKTKQGVGVGGPTTQDRTNAVTAQTAKENAQLASETELAKAEMQPGVQAWKIKKKFLNGGAKSLTDGELDMMDKDMREEAIDKAAKDSAESLDKLKNLLGMPSGAERDKLLDDQYFRILGRPYRKVQDEIKRRDAGGTSTPSSSTSPKTSKIPQLTPAQEAVFAKGKAMYPNASPEDVYAGMKSQGKL